MFWFYIIIALVVIGLAVYFIVKEYKKGGVEKENVSGAVLKNKRKIEKSVKNIESMIVLADGNEKLCNKLVELKDEVRFLNPSKSENVALVDEKIANRLDDLKIEISKDQTAETIWRIIEEIEGYIAQRE